MSIGALFMLGLHDYAKLHIKSAKIENFHANVQHLEFFHAVNLTGTKTKELIMENADFSSFPSFQRGVQRGWVPRVLEGAVVVMALSTVSAAVAADNAPSTVTRASVIAELQAARARGELQAGHLYGVDVPEAPRGPATPVAQTKPETAQR